MKSEKFFNVDSLSIPGDPKKPNEDHAGWDSKRTAWIIDGATGLGNCASYLGMKEQTDAGWLAQRLHTLFLDRANHYAEDHFGLLNECRDVLRREFESNMKSIPEASYAWPCAALSILHWGLDEITVTSLGDCTTVLILAGNGLVSTVLDESLVKLDRESIALMEQYRDPSGGTGGVRGKILPRLRDIRMMGNVAAGYSVFALDKEIMPVQVLQKMHPAKNIEKIIMATDGAWALVNDYNHFTPEKMAEVIEQEGISQIFEILRNIEDSDPLALKFPRFKKSDDASVLTIQPV